MNALLFGSHSAPNEAPVNLDDEYTRERVTFRVTHPLRQDSTLSLTASGAFEADDLDHRPRRAPRSAKTACASSRRGCALRGAATATRSIRRTCRFARAWTHSAAACRRTDLVDDPRRADFLVAQLQGTAYRRFAELWSVRVDAFSQFIGYVLPDSERFKIGGDRLGRGFEVAEIAGDRGAGRASSSCAAIS